MRILIAVPTYETIYPDTFKSLYGLDGGEHELMFDFVRGYDVASARNNIAKLAIESGADYVMMVDNDVVLPRDALMNLLDDPKDVCLGYYAHRDKGDNVYRGNTCICKLDDENGNRYFSYPLESEYTSKELIEAKSRGEYKIRVHGGGMGCSLVKTSVYDEFVFPWYSWRHYANGLTMSEDLDFCERCGDVGIPIWVDTRVACGHIFRHIQWPV